MMVKVRIDGIDPLDRQQRRGVGHHHVSYVDQARAGPAVNGRVDVAVLKIELGGFKRGLRRFHLGLVHVNRILLGVPVLLRNRPGAYHFLIACELDVRQIKCSLGLRQRRLCRVHLSLERPWIDHKQQLPLAQVLAILKMPLGDAPADLRSYCNRLERGVSADLVEVFRNILCRCLHHRDQRGRHRRRSLHIAPAAGRNRQQRRQERGEHAISLMNNSFTYCLMHCHPHLGSC